MEQSIEIVIADDHLLFIEGVKSLLLNEPRISVIGVAHDGKDLLNLLHTIKPRIVLLDINMPFMNGIDVCRYIEQSYSLIKVIMLSTYSEEHLIEKAKANGAHGYLLKNCNKDELLQTIISVNDGKASFPYRLPKAVTRTTDGDNFLKRFDLTKRETEVLRLIKQGYTNQDIADSLFLSIYTVETHRKNIKQKLGLNKPGALMKFLSENTF